jgi:hypothetical protein
MIVSGIRDGQSRRLEWDGWRRRLARKSSGIPSAAEEGREIAAFGDDCNIQGHPRARNSSATVAEGGNHLSATAEGMSKLFSGQPAALSAATPVPFEPATSAVTNTVTDHCRFLLYSVRPDDSPCSTLARDAMVLVRRKLL